MSATTRRCLLAVVGASNAPVVHCSPRKMVWGESRPEASVRKAITTSKRTWMFLGEKRSAIVEVGGWQGLGKVRFVHMAGDARCAATCSQRGRLRHDAARSRYRANGKLVALPHVAARRRCDPSDRNRADKGWRGGRWEQGVWHSDSAIAVGVAPSPADCKGRSVISIQPRSLRPEPPAPPRPGYWPSRPSPCWSSPAPSPGGPGCTPAVSGC
jgi:hypothetical protein